MTNQQVSSMGYSASFTYPTDLSCMSNRSRSDSGTSGSSASTNGSGRPPRRRSHRPRGCRGGSSRRSRNNSLDDKSAKKINTHNSSNAIANNNMNPQRNNNNNNNSYHESSRRKGNGNQRTQVIDINSNTSKSKRSENVPIILTKQREHKQLQQRCRANSEEQVTRRGAPVKEFSFDNQEAPTGKPYSSYPNSGSDLHSSNHTLTTVSGDDSLSCLSRNPAMDYDMNSSFGYDTSSYYQHSSSSFDVPGLQQSFSDSSEGIILDHQRPHENYLSNSANGIEGGPGCHILPPMPSPEFLQNEPHVSAGPNPYALKLCTHADGYMPHQPQQGNCTTNPTYQEPSLFMDTTNFSSSDQHHYRHPNQLKLQGGSTGGHYHLHHHQSNNNTMHHSGRERYPQQQPRQPQQELSYDYHAERLQKQRQTVEGGSLFATSPRSFLMGFKNSPLVAAA